MLSVIDEVKYLIIIPKEVDQEDDQETDGGIVYKRTLRSVKLTTGKKGKKTELTGKGPLRRRRSSLDCSATEEEVTPYPLYRSWVGPMADLDGC
jgi:hypothetical protein